MQTVPLSAGLHRFTHNAQQERGRGRRGGVNNTQQLEALHNSFSLLLFWSWRKRSVRAKPASILQLCSVSTVLFSVYNNVKSCRTANVELTLTFFHVWINLWRNMVVGLRCCWKGNIHLFKPQQQWVVYLRSAVISGVYDGKQIFLYFRGAALTTCSLWRASSSQRRGTESAGGHHTLRGCFPFSRRCDQTEALKLILWTFPLSCWSLTATNV